ncbi:amidohydrolase [Amycolatopsis sp. WAC 01375]|uniref:amidohydrolase family protein n=1 Tax=unclassified Amycolatopsis TaxID=2618356 RepID=UPI000F767905|nr:MULTISPECIES: amidohydrolase family protein [unclassified Amycolatopsis]RSM73327.1 amidohydrolase [Amycolatopsis sp. WAC 01375]RSN19928.1 amidohydrolase [Amycolatopsis sp. WAC 01416]
MVFIVRGVTLPARQEQTFVIDGGKLHTHSEPDAELLSDGGWILPGLVDVHTHPGADEPDKPFEEQAMRRHLLLHRDAGVLAVRMPGFPVPLPKSVYDDPELPWVRSAGRWLATPGHFFPGFGRDVTEDELAAAAVEESLASSGWCKVIGDWKPDQKAVPLGVLKEVVAAVHDVGGRVAVHCQTADGCHNAVHAGADSLEHGMHLDHALLGQMAAQGTALVPTLSAFSDLAEVDRSEQPDAFQAWLLAGWDGMLPTVYAAYQAGVTVLAGTDIGPFGNVTTEIGWLIKAGLPVETAIGAASWTARSWLGLPNQTDSAPADLVIYDEDPTVNPDVLAHPSRIILRGRLVR